MDSEHREDEEVSFLSNVPSVSLDTLQRVPYRRRCRVCRSFFRSERARDGYCPSCRQILDDKTRELEAILVAAEGQKGESKQLAMEKVQKALRCPILMADGLACDWAGNRARYWPRTTLVFRRLLRGFVERLQRHVYVEHCFPGRFGRAAERRAQKQFEGLCLLPEDRQPEAVKLHLRTRKWLEAEGIPASVRWSLEERPPKLLSNRVT